MTASIPELLGVRELARRLSMSQSAVRRFAYRGQIPFVKIGTRLLFEPASVEAFLNQHRKVADPISASDIRQALGIPAANRPRGLARPRVELEEPTQSTGLFAAAPAELIGPAPSIQPNEITREASEQPQPDQPPADPAQPFRDAFRKALGTQP